MKTLIISGIGAYLLSGCTVGGFSDNSSVLAVSQTEKFGTVLGQTPHRKAASPTTWEPRQ